MIVGVPRETYPDERRVAMVPAILPTLTRIGFQVSVEQEAGVAAGFPDASYEEQGARIVAERAQLYSSADVLILVHGVGANPSTGTADLELLRADQVMLGLLNPLGAPKAAQKVASKGATAFALELVPRISRAQPMDALTAMATVAGYKAALMAADALPKMYPMMITAAGTITPAKAFIVGAGVAGLQAIATSRRLGAVVQAYDVRPAVKEQVESLGARFLETELETGDAEAASGYAQAMGDEFYSRQREMMTQAVAESDVVITTAAVPGGKAPVLITTEMVREMRNGSVIVDLAAAGGGNCELTRPGETVVVDGVTIVGPMNLPSTIPHHASQMYAKNVASFLQNVVKDGELRVDLGDQIIRDSLLTHRGEVVNSQVRELLGLEPSTPSIDERSGT